MHHNNKPASSSCLYYGAQNGIIRSTKKNNAEFVPVFNIHIAYQMWTHIITNIQFFQLAIVTQLPENVFIELFKVLLNFFFILLQTLYILVTNTENESVHNLIIIDTRRKERTVWRGIHVHQHQGLANGWPVVQSRTALSETASPDFEVERAINLQQVS